ncbi:hypothetical protein FORC087_280 (plasmid) [Bacillus cereus]|nr:hypothetical protein FORC087_280 [Bacillus cereus]
MYYDSFRREIWNENRGGSKGISEMFRNGLKTKEINE